MNLDQLSKLLTRIVEIFEGSGAKRQAEGIRILKDVLSEEVAISGDAGLDAVQGRLAAYAQSKKRSVRQPKISVEEYVARLESLTAVTDLNELVREFETGAFKKADLDKIARLYAKGPSTYKSKAEAIRDIERRFTQRTRATNELEYLEKHKVTPW